MRRVRRHSPDDEAPTRCSPPERRARVRPGAPIEPGRRRHPPAHPRGASSPETASSSSRASAPGVLKATQVTANRHAAASGSRVRSAASAAIEAPVEEHQTSEPLDSAPIRPGVAADGPVVDDCAQCLIGDLGDEAGQLQARRPRSRPARARSAGAGRRRIPVGTRWPHPAPARFPRRSAPSPVARREPRRASGDRVGSARMMENRSGVSSPISRRAAGRTAF